MQSYANINSFPIGLELGRPEAKEWAWTRQGRRFDLFQECTRFLRQPGPEKGTGYRMVRVGAILLLRARGVWRMPSYDLE